MKAYLRRWDAVAEIERQELITATIEQRWRQLNAIMGMAIGLGLGQADHDELEVFQRWAKLKEKATDRHPATE